MNDGMEETDSRHYSSDLALAAYLMHLQIPFGLTLGAFFVTFNRHHVVYRNRDKPDSTGSVAVWQDPYRTFPLLSRLH